MPTDVTCPSCGKEHYGLKKEIAKQVLDEKRCPDCQPTSLEKLNTKVIVLTEQVKALDKRLSSIEVFDSITKNPALHIPVSNESTISYDTLQPPEE